MTEQNPNDKNKEASKLHFAPNEYLLLQYKPVLMGKILAAQCGYNEDGARHAVITVGNPASSFIHSCCCQV